MNAAHAMRFGATVLRGGGVRFALWAPRSAQVAVQRCDLEGQVIDHFDLQRGADGWHEGVWADAAAGMRYRFVLDAGLAVPDPASRCNPQGVHAPSEVIDPCDHAWTDAGWTGLPWQHASLYELHIGSFTPEGTFDAAAARLPYLHGLGVRAVQLMPLAAFSGRRGWGYDGVLPFAPHAAYGTPQQLKRFVQSAHRLGLMVLLDVVYNHFGADGNYLHAYCPDFFDTARTTPWGPALRFEGEGACNVRRFFVDNALYWIHEYRFDGLRLDAVHAMHDTPIPHIVEQIAAALRDGPGRERHVHLVLENDDNRATWLARDRAGQPRIATAQWNDDWHHAAHVLATREHHGYYRDYQPGNGERGDTAVTLLARALAEGFVYQGQRSAHRGGAPRGEPSAQLPSSAFVDFLQNHDQIGNRAFGERLDALAPRERVEVLLACLLLSPQVPLLFMGEEFAASTPFLYFCDYDGDLGAAVREGRRREFAAFARWRDAGARASIPDPNAPGTFDASKLRWDELSRGIARRRLALVQQLLSLRRKHLEPHLGAQRHGGHMQCDGRSLRVDWTLGAAVRWTLRASFGIALPAWTLDPGEQVIYRSDGNGDAGRATDAPTDAPTDAIWVTMVDARQR